MLPEDLKADMMLEHLILQGGIVFDGVDEYGEITYEVTDKMKLISPDLYDKIKKEIEKDA